MNTALDGIGAWLVQTSLYGSVLILLVLALRRAGVARLHPRWAFALWIVVLARLVLPTAPETRFSLFNVAEAGRPVVARVVGLDRAAVPERDAATGDAVPPSGLRVETQAPASRTGWWTPARGLVLAWIVGAAVAAGAIGLGQRRLVRMAARARQVCDPDLVALVEECKARLGVRSPIMVAHSEGVASPLLLGTVRPVLLIPDGLGERLGRDERRAVVMHEVAHVRRCDIALGWAATAALVLHWFNPLVWLAVRRMKEDREVACDALALSALGDAERPAYGRALVTLLEDASQPRIVPGLAAIAEGTGDLKRRIAMIASFRERGRWSAAAAGALVTVLACVSLTDAQSVKAPEPPVVVGPAPADVTSEGVLAKMREVYAGCDTYEDEGVVTRIFLNRAVPRITQLPFKTSFVREKQRLRYEFRDGPNRYVVWGDENGARSWWTIQPDVKAFATIEEALGGPSGVSGGSATMIPPLLMPEIRWGAVLAIVENAEVKGVERVGDRACYRVEAEYLGGMRITLWVDTETHLLRRTQELREVDPDGEGGEPPLRFETVMTFDPKINGPVPEDRLGFVPPEK